MRSSVFLFPAARPARALFFGLVLATLLLFAPKALHAQALPIANWAHTRNSMKASIECCARTIEALSDMVYGHNLGSAPIGRVVGDTPCGKSIIEGARKQTID